MSDRFPPSVVRVKTKAIPDARSNRNLGQNREGTGVVIDELGHIVTIGYLVIEAESIEVTTQDNRTVPASLIGYDHASGFGLLRSGAQLGVKPMRMGQAADVGVRDPVMILPAGGRDAASIAYVISKRKFSAGWEYLLESAIFTAPPTLQWAGAALVSREGKLVGIGSLLVRETLEGGAQVPGNMFVPIDLLKPILAEIDADMTIRRPTTDAEVIEMAKDADGIIMHGSVPLSRDTISKMKRVKVVARTGVGVDTVDLDTATLDPLGFDASFCRWVACFVTHPERLVQNLARALAPGGRAVFQEYVDYRSWRTSPPAPVHERFVEEVIASWRDSGGEPDIAQQLPSLLVAHGFRIEQLTPLVFCTRPGDAVWPWPKAFIEIGAERFTVDDDIAKVSLVGAGMKSHPGVAADMFDVLAAEGINIEMISTSPIRVSCVIRRSGGERALQAVHTRFGLDAS